MYRDSVRWIDYESHYYIYPLEYMSKHVNKAAYASWILNLDNGEGDIQDDDVVVEVQ